MEDLREFLAKCEEIGELSVVDGAHWDLEIGAATYLAAEGPNPPALLFDNVPGYKPGYRVLAAPCVTERRMALAYGFPLELRKLDLVKHCRRWTGRPYKAVPAVDVKDGPVFQNVHTGDEVDLFEFPTPKWQELDGGRYIGTGDTVIVKDPDEGWVNVGVHRMQIHDKNTATIFFEPGRHGDIIRKKYWSRGQSCPVAVTCGGDPLLPMLAGNQIPWGTCEYDHMGWWREKAVEVIKGPMTGLPIPAAAEIAFEGEMLPPAEGTLQEGPFSEWPGAYTPAKPESPFKVKSVLHRDDPIILGMLPYLGPGVTWPTGHIMRAARTWDELDRIVPGVKGVWCHTEFGPRGAIVISIQQKYGGQAKQAAMLALTVLGYMEKLAIVVDDDVDPSNLREVLFAIATRFDPERFDIIRDCWGGALNPLLPPERRERRDYTHTAGIILACKPFYWIDQFPPPIKTKEELRQRVRERWGKLLLPE